MKDCLFCKIINKDIPSHKVFEDKHTFCLLDINPVNEGHILVIPIIHSNDLLEMTPEDIAHSFTIAKRMGEKIMDKLGADGFNLLVNTKPEAGQVILHTHIHVVPRFIEDKLKHWPGKSYQDRKAEEILKKLKE
jgi:histidine triad (HIT) family protein